MPTTPPWNDIIRNLHDIAQGGAGLPLWAQIALPVCAALVGAVVGATTAALLASTSRKHDKSMRLDDALRRELVETFQVVADANDALSEAASAAHGLRFFVIFDAELTDRSIAPDATRKALTDEAWKRADDLRAVEQRHERSLQRLVLKRETLKLLRRPEDEVIQTLSALITSHEAATWSTKDLWVVPGSSLRVDPDDVPRDIAKAQLATEAPRAAFLDAAHRTSRGRETAKRRGSGAPQKAQDKRAAAG